MIPRLSLIYFAFGYPIGSSLFVEKLPWLNCIAFLFFKWQRISNEAKSLALHSKLRCFFCCCFFGGWAVWSDSSHTLHAIIWFVPRQKQHKIGDHSLNFSINYLNSHLVFSYWFVFGCAGSSCCEQRLLSSCGAQASLFWGFSCGAQAVGTQTSVAVACWLWSADSVVAACRLNIISSYCQTNLCLAMDLTDKTCACGNG